MVSPWNQTSQALFSLCPTPTGMFSPHPKIPVYPKILSPGHCFFLTQKTFLSSLLL